MFSPYSITIIFYLMFFIKIIFNLKKQIGKSFQYFSSAQPSLFCRVIMIFEMTVCTFFESYNKLSVSKGPFILDVIHEFSNPICKIITTCMFLAFETHIFFWCRMQSKKVFLPFLLKEIIAWKKETNPSFPPFIMGVLVFHRSRSHFW